MLPTVTFTDPDGSSRTYSEDGTEVSRYQSRRLIAEHKPDLSIPAEAMIWYGDQYATATCLECGGFLIGWYATTDDHNEGWEHDEQ
jgi:hypothetical protein